MGHQWESSWDSVWSSVRTRALTQHWGHYWAHSLLHDGITVLHHSSPGPGLEKRRESVFERRFVRPYLRRTERWTPGSGTEPFSRRTRTTRCRTEDQLWRRTNTLYHHELSKNLCLQRQNLRRPWPVLLKRCRWRDLVLRRRCRRWPTSPFLSTQEFKVFTPNGESSERVER